LIDFQVYFGAAKNLLMGVNPYKQLYFKTIPFNYPPSAFLFLLPLSFFSIKTSQYIWFAVSIICLFIVARILFSLFIPKEKKWIKLILLALLLQNFPTKFTLVMGQINFQVLLLIILSFYYYVKKKEKLPGVFLGLAAAIKLNPILLVVFFAIKKKFKIVFITFLINLLFLIISPSTSLYYKSILPDLLNLTGERHYYDQSFIALVARLGLNYNLGRALNYVFLGGGTLFILKNLVKKKDFLHQFKNFSLLLLLITMFNAFAWQHHLVFLFPAFLAASFIFLKTKNITFGFFLIISAFLVGFHFSDFQHPWLTNPFIASHGFWGGMVLWILLNSKTLEKKIVTNVVGLKARVW